MKFYNEIKLSSLDINSFHCARNEIHNKIDLQYCENRFGKIETLDINMLEFIDDLTNFNIDDLLDVKSGYMQISSSKLECTKTIVEKYDLYNLYDIDFFKIEKINHNNYNLIVVTDFSVEKNINFNDAFNLTVKDFQQLNLIAEIAVIDLLIHAIKSIK